MRKLGQVLQGLSDVTQETGKVRILEIAQTPLLGRLVCAALVECGGSSSLLNVISFCSNAICVLL